MRLLSALLVFAFSFSAFAQLTMEPGGQLVSCMEEEDAGLKAFTLFSPSVSRADGGVHITAKNIIVVCTKMKNGSMKWQQAAQLPDAHLVVEFWRGDRLTAKSSLKMEDGMMRAKRAGGLGDVTFSEEDVFTMDEQDEIDAGTTVEKKFLLFLGWRPAQDWTVASSGGYILTVDFSNLEGPRIKKFVAR